MHSTDYKAGISKVEVVITPHFKYGNSTVGVACTPYIKQHLYNISRSGDDRLNMVNLLQEWYVFYRLYSWSGGYSTDYIAGVVATPQIKYGKSPVGVASTPQIKYGKSPVGVVSTPQIIQLVYQKQEW